MGEDVKDLCDIFERSQCLSWGPCSAVLQSQSILTSTSILFYEPGSAALRSGVTTV